MNPHLSIEPMQSFINSHIADWQRLLQALVRIPSTFENERQIVDYVEAYLNELGVEVHAIPHDPAVLAQLPDAQSPISTVAGRKSLVAVVRARGGGQSLALNAHLDVVPEGDTSQWKYPPYSAYIDESQGILYGRGATDDKAGIAILLGVLETIVKLRLPLKGDLYCHFVLEDETTGNGTLLCLTHGFGADAALIVDGTRLDKAIHQHAGNLQFELIVQGKPASVSVSHMGVNAAEVMAQLLLELKQAIHAMNQDRQPPWTIFPSPYQMVTQRFFSEGKTLTVPDEAHSTIYVTFPPPHTLASMRQFITEKVQQFATHHALEVPPRLVWEGFATEPVIAPLGELEACLQRSASEVGLDTITISPSTGTSDLRHFAAQGIPTILYGPGRGYNPHRADEHYFLDDLERMISLCLHLAINWCGIQHGAG